MTPSLDSSVAAILGPQGGIVGTGFVAAGGLILTCAHVIEAAGSGPGQSVNIRFYRHNETYSVRVSFEMWSPKAEADVAALEWPGDLPAEVRTIELGDAAGSVDHKFSALGFAPISKAQWLRATGDIKALLPTPGGQSILQLTSQEPDHGMSGAPVLDEARGVVVGMISGGIDSSRLVKNRDTVFAIPAETLRRVCAPLAMPRLWPLGHSFATSPHFTGRADERNELSAWLNSGPAVLVLRALGGFGKSALAWHWLMNDVVPTRWPRAVWWSFYDDSSIEKFLEETLPHFGIDPRGLGPRPQADKLLEQLAHSGTLLILDGFERALRAFSGMNAAYQGDEAQSPSPALPLSRSSATGEGLGVGVDRDCLSPIAEHFLRGAASRPGLRGRILITTRLRPRALETHAGLLANCRERELTELSSADAYALFHSLGVIGTRAEIEAACAPYGYHPLSLSLLAGLILNDPRQPNDIAVAQRLDISGDIKQRQHHVLQQAYDSLTPARQQLLSRLACFRSPMDEKAIAAIASPSPQKRGFLTWLFKRGLPSPSGRGAGGEGELDSSLRDLLSRGLLHHDRQSSKYDLHPIVRRYAYARLTDKTAAHIRLRDYFAKLEVPSNPRKLNDLVPLIELYHHTASAGQYDEALTIFLNGLHTALYQQFGAYQLHIELLKVPFVNGEYRLPRLKDETLQSWTLNAMANSYCLSGQPYTAVPLYETSNALDEKRDDKKSIAIGLGNIAALAQMSTGALRSTEANLRRSITLCREISDEALEALGGLELGHILIYLGRWDESEQELAKALALFEKEEQIRDQGVTWAYRAKREILYKRDTLTPDLRHSITPVQHPYAPSTTARYALEFANDSARLGIRVLRNDVRAYWLLGAAFRTVGDYAEAELYLTKSLAECRGINLIEIEADILIDLARLRAATDEPEEATRLAQEALEITERCGYVLQGADAHLELAKLALRRDLSGLPDPTGLAREHARAARQLATCDGAPDYTYKVAYDEAGALLEQLGEPQNH